VNTIDGVRITFPQGWGLLRASNTQPVLVMRFEATDAALRDKYRAELEEWLEGQKTASAREKSVSGQR
jgi:phosphomannomutase/phosphoglucomutase